MGITFSKGNPLVFCLHNKRDFPVVIRPTPLLALNEAVTN